MCLSVRFFSSPGPVGAWEGKIDAEKRRLQQEWPILGDFGMTHIRSVSPEFAKRGVVSHPHAGPTRCSPELPGANFTLLTGPGTPELSLYSGRYLGDLKGVSRKEKVCLTPRADHRFQFHDLDI